MASKRTLEKLRKQPQYLDSVFAAKTNRTKMEEEPVETVPSTEPEDFIIVENGGVDADRAAAANDNTVADRTTAPAATEERPARRPRRAPMYDSAADAPEGLIPQAAVTAADDSQATDSSIDECDSADAYDRRYSGSNADNADADNTLDLDSDEFDLSSITTRDKSREEIIAAAEAAAFGEEEA